MRRLLAALLLASLGFASALAQSGWTNSYEEALQASRESGRPVLAYFTGSDWCPWCQKLDHEVLETPEFKEWASQYVVLLALDFPRSIPQVEALKRQNSILQEKYKVHGYPEVVMLASDGRVVARQGYEKGGAGHWIGVLRAKVNLWLAKHSK